jgi:hypothetical protein
VPVYVRVNGAVSNPTALAIMPQGGVCSDAHNPISAALVQGGKMVNGLFYESTASAGQLTGYPLAFFVDRAPVGAVLEPGGQFAFDPSLATPPRGTCTDYTFNGDILTSGFQMASGTPLDLGTLSANSAGDSIPLTSRQPGLYDTLLGNGYPVGTPFFVNTAIPTLNASGGADGQPFAVPVPPGVNLTGANLQGLINITRPNGATISWTVQAGVSAYVAVGVYDQPTNSSVLALCVSAAGASGLTVPDYVLANLPPTHGVSDEGDAMLLVSAWPTLSQTTTPDQIQIFSARQDMAVFGVTAVH